MERLTYRGTQHMTEDGMVTPAYSDYSTRRIIDKLADYEDAEEQGLLLRLPYPPGTKVYYLDYNEDYDEIYYEIREAVIDYRWANCSRKMYLTREEAEKALEDMQKGIKDE